MKTLSQFLFILLSLSTLVVQAQDPSRVGEYIKVTRPVDLYPVALQALPGTPDLGDIGTVVYDLSSTTPDQIPTETIFKIVGLDADENVYILRTMYGGANILDGLFAIAADQINDFTKRYRGEEPNWSVLSTAITLPVKIRFGDGEDSATSKRFLNFEGGVNIGAAVGIRKKLSKSNPYFLNTLIGINIGSTKVTPETTNNEVSSDSNQSILSVFSGVQFEYDDFQVGLFLGWDHIGGKLGKSWDYQGNTWLGIGIGYNIFTTNSNVNDNKLQDRASKKITAGKL